MRRRWLLIAAATFGGLAVVVAAGVPLLYGRVGAWAIESRVVPRLEARLGRDVSVGAVEVSRGEVVLRDLVIPGDDGKPLVSIGRVTAEVAFWPSLIGDVEVGEVTIADVTALAVRRKDGDTFTSLISKLRSRGDETG